MRATTMLGVALLFFAWMMLYPVSQAQAFFAEDSFAPFWEQGTQPINPGPAGQPVKTGQFQEQSNAPEVTHRVAPGETLWSLARYYHVELARLMAVNKISDSTRLSVGRILVIPGARRARSTERPRRFSGRGGQNSATAGSCPCYRLGLERQSYLAAVG